MTCDDIILSAKCGGKTKDEYAEMKISMFNMIEIVLAIGIAAFGIMAVVAMIPPALNANRDVSADSFAQEAASKMVFLVNFPPAGTTFITADTNVVEKTKMSADEKILSGIRESTIGIPKFDNDTKKEDASIWKNPNDDRTDWNIYNIRVENKDHLAFLLESSDHSVAVHALVWKTDIKDFELKTGGDYTFSRYFIEISWPINVTYPNRNKRLIFFDKRN